MKVTNAGLQSDDDTQDVSFETIFSGTAKSWADFDGTGTPAFNDSFNHGSLTDLSTGYYRLSFSSAKASSAFAAHATSTVTSSSSPDQTRAIGKTTSEYDYFHAENEPSAATDVSINNGTSYGDLA